MARLRFNDIGDRDGLTNPITVPLGAGTCSWDSDPGFPTITAPDYAILIINPGVPTQDIRKLTAYTDGALTGTVSGALTDPNDQPSTGLAHTDAGWVHGPTAADFILSDFQLTAKNSNYSASSHDLILGTAGSGGFTVTLPAPTDGAEVWVKKIDGGAGSIVVQRNSTETIDGLNSVSLDVRYDHIRVVAFGGNWHILDGIVGSLSVISVIESVPAENLKPLSGWDLNGQQVFNFLQSGWVSDKTTWTRKTNTTFGVPGNVVSRYQKGVLVKWMEGGATKYGIVASSAYTTETTVTLVSTSDYVMAGNPDNASNYIAQSWFGIPYDFPTAFTWSTAALTGGTGPSLIARFSIKPGRRMVVEFSAVLTTSNDGAFTITGLPLASSGNNTSFNGVLGIDNSTPCPASANVNPNSTVVVLNRNTAMGMAWVASGIKSAVGSIEYAF